MICEKFSLKHELHKIFNTKTQKSATAAYKTFYLS